VENRLFRVLAAMALIASMSVSAHAAATTDDPDPVAETLVAGEFAISGEIQRIVVEPLVGETVEATAIVTDDGEVVRVPTDELTDVPTGAIVEILTPVVDASVGVEDLEDVLDPDAGVELLEMEVLELPEDAAPSAVDSQELGTTDIAMLPTPVYRTVHMVTASLPGQAAPGVTTSRLAADLTQQAAPYWSDSTDGLIRFSSGSQTAAGTYAAWPGRLAVTMWTVR